MIPIRFEDEKGFEIVCVNGKPYMFTNMRIDRETLPEGFVAYDVRDDDELSGSFAQIKRFVMVNHWGTIIGTDEIPLDPEYGDYYPEEEEPFIGEYVKSAEEFASCYDELLERCEQGTKGENDE